MSCHQSPVLFFWNSTCLNCYCSVESFISYYFFKTFSDVSRGPLGISLPTPKDSNVRSDTKLDVGNNLADEISRNFFYIIYKGQNLLS